MKIIAFQEEFRPDLPNVYETYDYRTFRDILIKIDEVLTRSGLEHDLVLQALNQSLEKNQVNSSAHKNEKNLNYRYKIFKHALRCNIARHLTGESYRLFSLRLADSTLFQWFTGINNFGSRKAISKSALTVTRNILMKIKLLKKFVIGCLNYLRKRKPLMQD